MRDPYRCSFILFALVALSACEAEPSPPPEPASEPLAEPTEPPPPINSVAALLADDEVVFGVFSGARSRAGGVATWNAQQADFQLYSMETGPFDVATMQDEFVAGMVDAGGDTALDDFPILVRPPAIHTVPDEIERMVSDALGAGIAGIVFPHVTTADEAARSVELVGGAGVNILIVEDQEGVGNVREIMATSGLDVVFAGPGDLSTAYGGDMVAVENAIQTVLDACLEFDVACGITAGVADIERRLDEGFEVIIVTEPAAIDVGMEYVGRM